MRDFIKKRINNIKSDSVLKFGCYISLIMLCCQTWMFFDSCYMWQPLLRSIFYFTLLFTIFFAGREGMFFETVLFAYSITPSITFFNFTPFLILLFNMMIKSKSNRIKDNLKIWLPMLIPYILLVFVACESHGKSASHLVYHFIGCFVFFSGDWFFVRNKKTVKSLVLDADQERILHDIATGKMQKEIDYFSKNTISEKIKTAIRNNNLLTKEQLMLRYMLNHPELT